MGLNGPQDLVHGLSKQDENMVFIKRLQSAPSIMTEIPSEDERSDPTKSMTSLPGSRRHSLMSTTEDLRKGSLRSLTIEEEQWRRSVLSPGELAGFGAGPAGLIEDRAQLLTGRNSTPTLTVTDSDNFTHTVSIPRWKSDRTVYPTQTS